MESSTCFIIEADLKSSGGNQTEGGIGLEPMDECGVWSVLLVPLQHYPL